MPKKRHLKKRQRLWIKRLLPVVLLIVAITSGFVIYLNRSGAKPVYTPAGHRVGEPVLKKVPTIDDALQTRTEPHDTASAQIDQLLVDKNFSGTALVYHNGAIILNKGYGFQDDTKQLTNSLSTQYCIGSIQKTITAYLIAKEIEQNHLRFDDLLSKFYPQIPNSNHITIKDMLTMSSGLRMALPPSAELTTTDSNEILKLAISRTTYAGNKKYAYQTINYNLLAGILEQLTKKDYYQLVEQQVIKKMDLKHTSFYYTNNPDQALAYSTKTGVPNFQKAIPADYALELGTGNLFMSTGDLFRFYQNLFSDRYLPEQLRTDLLQPYPNEKYASGNYDMTNYYHSRGVKIAFESILNYGADGQDCVILLSNQFNPKASINPLGDQIMKKIVFYPIRSV